MAKKKKIEPQASAPMTRGQQIRAHEEQKKIRNLYATAFAVGAVIVLLLAFAVISTFIIRPNAEVASVNGTAINRATYDKLRRYSLYQTAQNQAIQQQLSQTTGGTGSGLDAMQSSIDQLQNVSNEQTLDEATLNQLVDAAVLKQASTQQFSMNPSPSDLKTYALKDFKPQPTPPVTPEPPPRMATVGITTTGTITTTPTSPSPTATATLGSPTMTATSTATLPPVPGGEKTAEAVYSSYVSSLSHGVKPDPSNQFCTYGCPDISEQDYLGLIVEPQYRHDKVLDKLVAQSVVTDVEQIHVQHILTDTKEGALKIKQMLDNGANFAQLANTQSKEQLDNIKNGQQPNGGELGWTPKEDSTFVKPFIDAAWQVPTGKYSDPVQTTFGWHIIKVSERDPKRPLPDDILSQKKTKLYNDWFSKAREAAVITGVPKATPTPAPPTPAVSEPTTQPSGSPAAGTPGVSSPITGSVGVTGTQSLPATAPAVGSQTSTSKSSDSAPQPTGTSASQTAAGTATAGTPPRVAPSAAP